MKNKNALYFVLFSAILVLSVNLCMGQESGILGAEIEFQIVDEGYSSGYSEESYLVIRDAIEWAEVWERHSRILLLASYPEIDFSTNMVICAFMGEHHTTGYSISIEKVHLGDEGLYVMVDICHPPHGAIVGQAITSPYIIVCLERLDLEVVFDLGGDAQVTIPPPNVVVSIVSPTDSQTSTKHQTVSVSTNGSSVELFLNGVSQGSQTSGFHWDTTLAPGENNITAVAFGNTGNADSDVHMIRLDFEVPNTDYDNHEIPDGCETNNGLNPLTADETPPNADNSVSTNINWWIGGTVGFIAAFILTCIYVIGKNWRD